MGLLKDFQQFLSIVKGYLKFVYYICLHLRQASKICLILQEKINVKLMNMPLSTTEKKTTAIKDKDNEVYYELITNPKELNSYL